MGEEGYAMAAVAQVLDGLSVEVETILAQAADWPAAQEAGWGQRSTNPWRKQEAGWGHGGARLMKCLLRSTPFLFGRGCFEEKTGWRWRPRIA